jgi:hypothetical protein
MTPPRIGFRQIPSNTTTTTARTLHRGRVWLLSLTAVTLIASLSLFYGASHGARIMCTEAVPAVSGVINARQALIGADADAITALPGTSAPLTGPGNDYAGEITLATQSLQQVAAVNAAGTNGTQTLQLLGSMISTYSGMIENATTAYAGGNRLLGLSEFWYASNFLHEKDSLLDKLSLLDTQEEEALGSQDSSFWISTWTIPLWAVPAAALLATLVIMQVILSRRLRRTLNPGLAAATLLAVVALVAAPILAAITDHRLSTTVSTLGLVRTDAPSLSAEADLGGQSSFLKLLTKACPGCAATRNAVNAVTIQDRQAKSLPSPQVAKLSEQTDRLGAVASVDLGLCIGLGIGALAVGALVTAGLWRRIYEYRYQA